MGRSVTEDELRVALGDALLALNKENIDKITQSELVTLNKIGLRLIYHILNELKINIDG